MRRNKLSTAIFAGIAGVAGIAATGNAALYLNPDGTGQVLIYPYYTVNNGLQTLISVVNTTDQGKAVKVRFLEGYNSKEVLDFNLYLSPFDVWTAAVVASGSGAADPAALVTRDRSCTVPSIAPNTPIAFRNFFYSPPSAAADSGPQGLDRTREGHLEMIEMGVVTNVPGFPALNWITHVGGVPANCNAINAAWFPGGVWSNNAATAVEVPTGGLFGAAALVDVANGVMYSYVADAIDGFRTGTPIHTNPDNLLPDLTSHNTAPNAFESIVFYNGVAVTSVFPSPPQPAINTVSSIFMHSAVVNEYALDPDLQADTEWVITFPTKRWHVDQATVVGAPLPPFTRRFPAFGVSTPAPGRACVDVGLFLYDREENSPLGGIDFSPPPVVAGPQLCFQSQVLSFNQRNRLTATPPQPSKLLGSRLYTNIEPAAFGFQHGWLRVDFNGVPAHQIVSQGGLRYRGLPVTGFAVSRYINANAQPGVLANYSGLWKHRGERLILQ